MLLLPAIVAFGCHHEDPEDSEDDPLERPADAAGTLSTELARQIADPQQMYDDLFSAFGPGALQWEAPRMILSQIAGSTPFPALSLCPSYEVVYGSEDDLDGDQIKDELAVNYLCDEGQSTKVTGLAKSVDTDAQDPFGGFAFEIIDLTVLNQGKHGEYKTHDASVASVRNDEDTWTGEIDLVVRSAHEGQTDGILGVYLDGEMAPDIDGNGQPLLAGSQPRLEGWLAYTDETENVVLSVAGSDLVFVSACPADNGNRFDSGTFLLRDGEGNELSLTYEDCRSTGLLNGEPLAP
jgi:hypothetical protein